MKQIILVLILAIGTNGFSQMVSDSTAVKYRIATVQKQTFFNGNENPSMTYTEFLNDSGQLEIQTSWNNHFNSMSIKKYYFYNNKRQLIKLQSIHYRESDSTVSTEIFDYNKQGLLKNNSFGIIKYQYNRDSLLIEKIEKTAKPYEHSTKYSYDSLKRLAQIEKYFYSGLESRTTFEYDSKGKLIREVDSYFYGDKNNPSEQYEHVYEYDKTGLLTIENQKQTINEFSDKKETRIYKYTYTFKE